MVEWKKKGFKQSKEWFFDPLEYSKGFEGFKKRVDEAYERISKLRRDLKTDGWLAERERKRDNLIAFLGIFSVSIVLAWFVISLTLL